MSRLRAIAEEEHKLDLTPMIDVTFLLLLFFLCTLQFKTLEGKLSAYLPKGEGMNSGDEIVDKIRVVVAVRDEGARRDAADPSRAWDGRGRFVFVGRRIELKIGSNTYTELDDARERLEFLHASDPARPALVDARHGTLYSDVVGVIDALALAGFEDVTFVGARE